MKALASKPSIQKFLRYFAAYLLYAVLVLIGLLLTEGVRSNVLDLGAVFKIDPDLIHLMYSWGSYLIYLPYVFIVAWLESYMNNAAKQQQVVARARKVFLIELGIGLASLATMLLSDVILQQPIRFHLF